MPAFEFFEAAPLTDPGATVSFFAPGSGAVTAPLAPTGLPVTPGADSMAPGGFSVPAVGNAGWGYGLTDYLKLGGAALGALGGLGSIIGQVVSFFREAPEARSARHMAEQAMRISTQLYPRLVNVPGLSWIAPYTQDLGPQTYAPFPSTERLTQYYLARNWNLPTGVAKAMMAQAASQYRAAVPQRLSGRALAQSLVGTPEALAKAGVGTLAVKWEQRRRQMEKAAELAAWNLWRAQQIRELIG